MAGAPIGNKNGAKKNRLLTDTLRRELVQNPEEMLAIVRKTIECAKSGDPWAQSMVYERLDGKVAQAIIGGEDDDPPVRIARIELVSLADPK